MYIKVQKSGKGGNTGSCSSYANYLEKEDKLLNEQGKEKESFFSHEKDQVEKYEVINGIDNNTKKLGKKDPKFYSITISPSEKELSHIGNDSEKLKEYTRGVMDEYAKNFKRDSINSGKDIVYYGKIEHTRSYKGTDKEVRTGEAKQGGLKEGKQTHVHIIVSRKDKENRRKLSPLANEKGNNQSKLNGKSVQRGFDRSAFKTKCENKFDKQFDYKRDLKETFEYANKMKKSNVKTKIEEMEKEVLKPKEKEFSREQLLEQARYNQSERNNKKEIQEDKNLGI